MPSIINAETNHKIFIFDREPSPKEVSKLFKDRDTIIVYVYDPFVKITPL